MPRDAKVSGVARRANQRFAQFDPINDHQTAKKRPHYREACLFAIGDPPRISPSRAVRNREVLLRARIDAPLGALNTNSWRRTDIFVELGCIVVLRLFDSKYGDP